MKQGERASAACLRAFDTTELKEAGRAADAGPMQIEWRGEVA